MYNFLKYKHNWKRCLHCSGKIKRDKHFIYTKMYQCQQCEKEYAACVLRSVPARRRFYPKRNAVLFNKTWKIRHKFIKLIQKYREWRLKNGKL